MSKNIFDKISYEEGLRRTKEFSLETEYQMSIDAGMSPAEACWEWDI